MKVDNRISGDVAIVVLDGMLDSHTAPDVQKQLNAVVAEHDLVLLDLSRMVYLSSAGLRVLLLLYRQAQSTGAKVALSGISPEVNEVMAATGFVDFFTVVQNVDDGLEVLSR